MDRGREGKVTLISAPAGFGKTTLVSDWVNQKAEGRGPVLSEVEGFLGDGKCKALMSAQARINDFAFMNTALSK